MIRSFRDRKTERIWRGHSAPKLPFDIQNMARRKLRLLNNAETLDDLRIPSANRLEALSGRRKGQHSILIHLQWRLCFVWRDDGADQVEIVDYH